MGGWSYNTLSSDSILIESILLYYDFFENDYSLEQETILINKLDSLANLVNTEIFANYTNEESYEALKLLVENNIEEFKVFSYDEDCCYSALDRLRVCRNAAYRHFAVFTTGVVVIGTIGLIVVGATAGTGGAVLSGTLTVLRYEAVAETTAGLNLIAALNECNYRYDFEILSCPCQCDKTKFPCND